MRGDAKTLASFWTPDGEIVDAMGNAQPAAEMLAEVAPLAEGQQPRPVKLIGSKLRFLTSDVAIEDGESEVGRADSPGAVRGRFSAIWVKRDGKWRLASLREARAASPPARLGDLDWLIGKWSAATADTRLTVNGRWNSTKTFLLRDLEVERDGKVVFRGSQRIGWDPVARTLRSWTFDSDGGYGGGTWTREGDVWVVSTGSVLPDGRQTTARHIMTQQGDDRFTWTSVGGRIDGTPAADAALEFTRQTGAK